jgi:hypothetical protein
MVGSTMNNKLLVVCFNKNSILTHFEIDTTHFWNQKIMKKLNSSTLWDIMLCSKKQAANRDVSDICFMLVSCLVNSLNLKMESACSSETSVYFQQDYNVLYPIQRKNCWLDMHTGPRTDLPLELLNTHILRQKLNTTSHWHPHFVTLSNIPLHSRSFKHW